MCKDIILFIIIKLKYFKSFLFLIKINHTSKNMYLHKNPFLLINVELIKINMTGISLNTNSLRVHFIAIINNHTVTIIL